MRQLTQQLKSGTMEILEVPFPAFNSGHVLIRNRYSVISAGTEGKTVTDARKGYVAKARSRQKEVRQVLEMIKTKGFLSTYELVMNKLEAPSALGYSCAGEVIAVGEGVSQFQVGDHVACGGAPHADVVSVPVNLAVKVARHVDLRQAAFATIASIAIQGIRQAEIQMGSSCLIIGMGLIGQLTYLIVQASGMHPMGVDVSEQQLELCRNAGLRNVYDRNQEGIEDLILWHTNGHGADAVIIAAGTSSLDPVEFAGSAARHRAKVVVVGAVPTGFSRTNYYKKELDLRMSCSYGPGRYDSGYEEKGIDYPIGYVRWTENRNMQAFLDLLASKQLNIEKLITHTFPLEKAPDAYDMILSRQEPFAGVLIQYDDQAELKSSVRLKDASVSPEDVNVGFVGAGSFAQGTLLPNMKGFCNFVGVSTGRGNTSRYVADKYGFSYCADSADALFADPSINTLFIVTRHNLHAENVVKAIENGKHLFVEKPLAMNEAELNEIRVSYEEKAHQGLQKYLMVGFNRRFAPAVVALKKAFLPEQSKSIMIRVNSGIVHPDHWVNDPVVGGGRIIGEACHFIDLAMNLAGSPIVSVSAEAMSDPNDLNNTVVIHLKMQNGSTASINYFSNGNKQLSKEYIEVFCGGSVAVIHDFRELILYGNRIKKTKYKQDKGHGACVQAFLTAIKNGKPCPVPFEESYLSMLATFKVNQSILENRKILID
jgi:predicted dehydrogenase/threonine dehydrogenase-like Zn-dependent dehydrogenase